MIWVLVGDPKKKKKKNTYSILLLQFPRGWDYKHVALCRTSAKTILYLDETTNTPTGSPPFPTQASSEPLSIFYKTLQSG